MILIHEDILKCLLQMKVLFWRSQITSGVGIYSNLRKKNIQIFLFTAYYQCYPIILRVYAISRVNKPDNRYHVNKDMHWQYRGWIWIFSKNLQWKPLKRRIGVDTKSAIVNSPSEFIPTDLRTSIKSQNTIISTYINRNNNNI